MLIRCSWINSNFNHLNSCKSEKLFFQALHLVYTFHCLRYSKAYHPLKCLCSNWADHRRFRIQMYLEWWSLVCSCLLLSLQRCNYLQQEQAKKLCPNTEKWTIYFTYVMSRRTIWQMIELLKVSSLLTIFTQAACFFACSFDSIIITSEIKYIYIAGISCTVIFIAVVHTSCII